MQRRPSGNGWSLCSDPFTARDIGHRTSRACISRSLANGKSARWASPASTTGRSSAAPPRCCRPSTRRIFCPAHLADGLNEVIAGGKVSWVLEADLKNFFGSLSHEWVLRFVEHRVARPVTAKGERAVTL